MPRRGNDGKDLEALVEYIEKNMLPAGMQVTRNRKLRNGKKVNTAEFDIEIRGKLGGGQFSWLIECRDRPRTGKQGTSWIQQIAGKRTRHRFDRATAVSTTGFTPGAIEDAKDLNVELREVKSLTAKDFENWILFDRLTVRRLHAQLHFARIVLADETPSEVRQALEELLPTLTNSTSFLRSIDSGERLSINEAFNCANSQLAEMYAGLGVAQPSVLKRIAVDFLPHGDHFEIDTKAGIARVEGLIFEAHYFVSEEKIPFVRRQGYENLSTGEAISQLASLAPVEIAGNMLALEMHKMADTGETYVTMRNTGPAAPLAPPLIAKKSGE